MMLDFYITLAQLCHVDILSRIALAAKRHWNYPEHWIEIWTPLLTITPEFISSADVWIAEENEEIAGFMH